MTTEIEILEIIKGHYNEVLSYDRNYEDCENPILIYTSNYIFGFNTYDDDLDILFATKAIEVCKTITNRENFKYIEDPESYKWFIIMLHMDFFSKTTSYGTSIRGSFWHLEEEVKNDIFLFSKEKYGTNFQSSTEEWKIFIDALMLFSQKRE